MHPVTTVKSGQEYRTTANHLRLTLMRDGDVVWIYSPANNLGGWKLDTHFGGTLSPASIRAFLAVS